jgi:hypothetical protein
VTAMHRALVGVERASHVRSADELLAYAADGRTSRREDGQRRSLPQQHPDLESLGQVAEEIAQRSLRLQRVRHPLQPRGIGPG